MKIKMLKTVRGTVNGMRLKNAYMAGAEYDTDQVEHDLAQPFIDSSLAVEAIDPPPAVEDAEEEAAPVAAEDAPPVEPAESTDAGGDEQEPVRRSRRNK